MKIKCASDIRHGQFYGVAIVKQGWRVDEDGNFLEIEDTKIETVEKPVEFECTVCGSPCMVYYTPDEIQAMLKTQKIKGRK